jgi:hypothetical protein
VSHELLLRRKQLKEVALTGRRLATWLVMVTRKEHRKSIFCWLPFRLPTTCR